MSHTSNTPDKPVDPLAFLDRVADEQAALITEAQVDQLLTTFVFHRRNLPFCAPTVESLPPTSREQQDNEEDN